MKVIAINGSPRPKGNTYLAIRRVFDTLEAEGIETEVLQVGGRPVLGCIACNRCVKEGRCTLPDEEFEALAQKIYDCDGLILAAPVYYGSMPGVMKTFLDRFFYQNRSNDRMRHKVGASAAILRRSGGRTTLNDLNHYFYSSEMLAVPTPGPNVIHGALPGEALQDKEGMDILQTIGKNMVWLLKMKEATKETVPPPPFKERVRMNFIRPEK